MTSLSMFQMAMKIGPNNAFQQYLGSFCRYKKIVTFLTSLTAAMSVMSMIDIMYLTATPPFWYVYDEEELNKTLIQMRIDVCKLENGTPIYKVGAGHWHFGNEEFQA